MTQHDPENERNEHLLSVAKTLQECQRIVDHYHLSDVDAAVESAIIALQRHVEFDHSPPEDLLKFFGLDDLKQAGEWWKKPDPDA